LFPCAGPRAYAPKPAPAKEPVSLEEVAGQPVGGVTPDGHFNAGAEGQSFVYSIVWSIIMDIGNIDVNKPVMAF